jgi:hypothetical protein
MLEVAVGLRTKETLELEVPVVVVLVGAETKEA